MKTALTIEDSLAGKAVTIIITLPASPGQRLHRRDPQQRLPAARHPLLAVAGQPDDVGHHRAGRRWQVRTDKKTYHVPMPPLVFVEQGHAYSLYVLKQKPLPPHTPLFHAPCPNMFAAGGICP